MSPVILNPIMVPSAVLERAGTEFIWPAGAWKGVLADTKTKDLPPFASGEKSGWLHATGQILSFRLTDNEPLDGQASVGNRIFFVDITVQDGPYDISTPYGEIPEDAWRLRSGVEKLTKLAAGLGQTDSVEIGGQPFTVIKDGFYEALEAGQFDGQSIGYIVFHRKRGDKTYVDISTFFAV